MKSVIVTSLFLAAMQATAGQTTATGKVEFKPSKSYLTIKSVEYKDLTDEYRLKVPAQIRPFNQEVKASSTLSLIGIGKAVEKVDVIVDKVINIGEKVWNIVEKGKPNQNYQNTVANALPANINAWSDLTNWKQPESKVIGVSYKNALGIEVVRFVYRVILLSGGSYNGVGNYIGYAAVEPMEMITSYMYTFNAQAVVVNIFNKGTRENPLSGMILTIRWTVETVLRTISESHTFFLDGAGNINAAEKKSLK